jgi:VCBS repeat-containing protein
LVGTYGSLSVNTTTGAYTYTPNATAINALNEDASDTFTVTVSDGVLSSTATYSVTIKATADTPPTAPASPNTTVAIATPAPQAPKVELVQATSSIYVDPGQGNSAPQTGVMAGGTVLPAPSNSAMPSAPPANPTTPAPNAAPERGSESNNAPAGGSTLVVNRAVPEVSFAAGQSLMFTLPADTFASSTAGQMTFKAVLVGADGRTEQALPSWIRFDPAAGTFSGEPPTGTPSVLRIKVIARDSQGNEAEVTLTIQNSSTSLKGSGAPAKPQSKLTDEAAVFAYDGEVPFIDIAVTEKPADKFQRLLKVDAKLAGRISLSEQIRMASRHRSGTDRLTMARRV